METIAEEIRSDTADTVDEKMDTDEKQTNCYWCVRMDGWMNLTSSFVADHFFTLLFIWFDFSGKDRNLNILELLCATCSRWFHESCIGFQLGKMVPFATNYTFFCKNCSPTGLESFRKNLACKLLSEFHSSRCDIRFVRFAAISQMCVTAIANLQQAAQKKGKTKYLFNKDDDIIPFMDQYWEAMTTMPRRVTQSWYTRNDGRIPNYREIFNSILNYSIRRYTTVQRTLTKENTVFTCEDTVEQQIFGLASTDLAQIKPNYEAMVRGGTLRITDDGYAQGKLNANLHHPMQS